MALIYYLIFPGFVFTALVGLLATWIDRKVSARVQWRQGPPWFQPFMDILKLLGKETIVPENASKMIFFGAPLVGLAVATLVSTILGLASTNPQLTFVGDLIVVLYLLTIPSTALIIGGSASGNPIAAIGSSREMKLILAYELPFIIAVFTLISKVGSISLGSILQYQASHGMLIGSVSGCLAFVVVLLVIQAKLGIAPFDIAEAEQEIMAGPLLEYSGPALALFRLTKAMLYWTLPLLMQILFLGGINLTSVVGVLWFILKYVIILTLIILIKNTNPRIRIDQAVRFFWGPVVVIAILAFVLSIFGW